MRAYQRLLQGGSWLKVSELAEVCKAAEGPGAPSFSGFQGQVLQMRGARYSGQHCQLKGHVGALGFPTSRRLWTAGQPLLGTWIVQRYSRRLQALHAQACARNPRAHQRPSTGGCRFQEPGGRREGLQASGLAGSKNFCYLRPLFFCVFVVRFLPQPFGTGTSETTVSPQAPDGMSLWSTGFV